MKYKIKEYLPCCQVARQIALRKTKWWREVPEGDWLNYTVKVMVKWIDHWNIWKINTQEQRIFLGVNCGGTIDGALYGLKGTQSNTLCSGFFGKTLSWGFWTIFFHWFLYRNKYKCVDYETCYEKYHTIWGLANRLLTAVLNSVFK